MCFNKWPKKHRKQIYASFAVSIVPGAMDVIRGGGGGGGGALLTVIFNDLFGDSRRVIALANGSRAAARIQ